MSADWKQYLSGIMKQFGRRNERFCNFYCKHSVISKNISYRNSHLSVMA